MISDLQRIARRVLAEIRREWLLNGLLASPAVPRQLRWRAFRAYGFEVERSTIGPKCWFGTSKVRIGRDVRINILCVFNTNAPIVLEDRCRIGLQTTFITATHEIGDESCRSGELTPKPIRVGSGTWVGGRCTILAGVTIGAGCVIAAGSVVTKDTEPNWLYGGVPAKKIRELPTAADRQAAEVAHAS